MRISSLTFNQASLANMMRSQEGVSQAMEQISSGKRYLQQSDSPVETNRIQLLKSNAQLIESYDTNNALAENMLSNVEENLQNVADITNRINVLQKQALNGTFDQSQRNIIATEMQAQLDALISVANRQDSDGNYIFSGFRTDVQPYSLSAGSYQYQGDAGQRSLQIGINAFVPVSIPGFSVFEDVKSGNGTFVTTDGVTANTGSAVISQGHVTDDSQFNNETYTLDFVTNGAGKLAYTVTGSTSGQLIPVLPATIPTDAPEYVNGGAIDFAGIELSITGEPKVGDDFAIVPSQPQNMFTTIKQMIAAVKMPTNNSSETAAFYNEVDRQAGALDNAVDSVVTALTQVGAYMNNISQEREINDDLKTYNSKTISLLEDIDVAEAVSRLTQQMNALQMAQLSYSKVQQLSLFNYL